jgi:hypothetical protein
MWGEGMRLKGRKFDLKVELEFQSDCEMIRKKSDEI